MGITAGTGDLQAPTHLPLRFVATAPFRAAAPGPLPSQPLAATEKTRRPRSSARPPATCTRTRMLPALPRVLAPSQLPPTQSQAPGARARGGCAASLEAGAGWKKSCRRMLRRGARRPPQSTRARIPQKFGSGSVGSEMQPKPHFSEPRANKHAQARTQTSPRLALAASGPGWPPAGPGREGKAQAREGSPPTSRSPRGGRSASAAHRRDVSARRHRPGLTVQRPAWACNSGVPVGLERPPERPGRRGAWGRKGAGEGKARL
nr:translation initiation factor IF-2-like [Chlorocebus sabaeus]